MQGHRRLEILQFLYWQLKRAYHNAKGAQAGSYMLHLRRLCATSLSQGDVLLHGWLDDVLKMPKHEPGP